MESTYNQLRDSLERYVEYLKSHAVVYLANDAYDDIQMKISHFDEIANEFKRELPMGTVQSLLVDLEDILGAESQSKLEDIVDRMDESEVAILDLMDNLQREMDMRRKQAQRQSDDADAESVDKEDVPAKSNSLWDLRSKQCVSDPGVDKEDASAQPVAKEDGAVQEKVVADSACIRGE